MSARGRVPRRTVAGPTHRSAPTPRGGTRGRHAGVVVPYGWLRRAAAIALASGAQRSICGAVARSGLESEQSPSPKGASNFGQSLSHGEAVTAPVVPKAWPPQTKRRWRLGRRSRCPKFFARYRSQNFDRCHSFLLASSATGGARKRPPFHKGALGGGSTAGGVPSTDRNIARRFYEKESKSLTLHHGPRGLG